ncbi:NAD(P)H-quinone oxidoreductase [Methylocaldum sp.]|uniref:NAD(P)H-quinone oxidoreductase n=1 Tax=Methylocaldum sp. TaxID=1969727 RepID=UPI002D480580|nr:NAD(P)H-quinone oxidoreductase [Methylocaldum sp.]HYE36993.1 NAD(P)H-quinone oxidoreductase [Methylocaldum sp.]
MAAIEIAQWGGPEVLQACRRPTPKPGPGEVLIEISAAGVNRPDVMQRKGLYPPPPGASDIPGLEIAGKVVALGEGVHQPAIGESVCALVTGGGYAEYCLAAAALCLPIPKGLGPIEAAAIPETFFTVWTNVFERGGLKAGESMLVHGGSSGIGTTAIQLAREFGAAVFATAGNPEKCRFCEQIGARAINYREEDFVDRIQFLTEGKGVNLILDMVGGPYLQRNLNCLAVDGRLIVIAVQGGPKTEINLLSIFLKRLTLTGSTLRPRSVKEKASIAGALRQKVWPLLESGQVKPVVHRVFSLAEASEAHRLMESSQHIGKIVLTVA